jgi:nicotinamidase-related amidase
MNRALIIIDMQKDFVYSDRIATIKNSYGIIKNLKEILAYFRKRNETVIHAIREYRKDGSDIEKFRLSEFIKKPYCVKGTEGVEIVDELKPIKNEIVLIKNRFSAFMQTELDMILKRKNITDLIIVGHQYPNCIRATAFDAVCLDYNVSIVYECTSAAYQEVADSNITDMKNIGIIFKSLKEVIAA